MQFSTSKISENKVYDVLIIGCGPVGLATAIGLKKRGINNILVIDQTHDFRKIGQVIDLLPNGLKALKYIDINAYKKIKEANISTANSAKTNTKNKDNIAPRKAWFHKNLQGEIIRSIPLAFNEWVEKYGEGRVSLHWYDLQTNLRNLLPSQTVQANHRCINLEQENEDIVRVDCLCDATLEYNPFAHWDQGDLKQNQLSTFEKSTSVQKSLYSKLVVAADGINSTVRQILYSQNNLTSWAKPSYSGFSGIFGFAEIPEDAKNIMQEIETKFFQGDSIVTIKNNLLSNSNSTPGGSRIILIRRSTTMIGYLIHVPLPLNSVLNESTASVLELAIEALEKADFPPIFRQLISLSNPEQVIKRAYYLHRVNHQQQFKPQWSFGRVVLAGDSAHGMPPFTAQGGNQGLEDAAIISTSIAKIINNHQLDDMMAIKEAFEKYEYYRRPLVVNVQEATMESDSWNEESWDEFAKMVYSRDFKQLMAEFI